MAVVTIGRISIQPTQHYLAYHGDVEWEVVVATILSPDKVMPSKRHGKNRFTYIKVFKEYASEIHVERDFVEDILWVINAFKCPK